VWRFFPPGISPATHGGLSAQVFSYCFPRMPGVINLSPSSALLVVPCFFYPIPPRAELFAGAECSYKSVTPTPGLVSYNKTFSVRRLTPSRFKFFPRGFQRGARGNVWLKNRLIRFFCFFPRSTFPFLPPRFLRFVLSLYQFELFIQKQARFSAGKTPLGLGKDISPANSRSVRGENCFRSTRLFSRV